MIERKLPNEQYELVPTWFIKKEIEDYKYLAQRDEENKDLLLLLAETLSDLVKRWICHTIAQEPDVIKCAQEAYRKVVDDTALEVEYSLQEAFED